MATTPFASLRGRCFIASLDWIHPDREGGRSTRTLRRRGRLRFNLSRVCATRPKLSRHLRLGTSVSRTSTAVYLSSV